MTLVAALIAACLNPSGNPTLQYRITELRVPGVVPQFGGYASAINDRGQVAGSMVWNDPLEVSATRWETDGTIVRLKGPADSTHSECLGMNEKGDCAGWWYSPGLDMDQAAAWINGTVYNIGVVPPYDHASYAGSINRSGIVVGSVRATGRPTLGFMWSTQGSTKLLPSLPGSADYASATDINDNGLVSGWAEAADTSRPVAVAWDNGTVVQLPRFPQQRESYASGSNELGDLVGVYLTADLNECAVIWLDASTSVELGQLAGGRWTSSNAHHINEIRQVLGHCFGSNEPFVPFVWCASTGMVNVRDRVVNGLGWVGDFFGEDLNNKGQIVGSGRYLYDGVNTRTAAYRLDPITTLVPPTSFMVVYGQKQSGNAASLATVDGNSLRVCRFLVPNQQTDPVQVRVEAFLPWQPMNLWFKATAKAASAGAFTWSLNLYDWTTNLFDPATNSTAELKTQTSALETIAKGDIGRYVRPSDRKVWALLRARAVGPTASLNWCVDVDQAAWEAVPMP